MRWYKGSEVYEDTHAVRNKEQEEQADGRHSTMPNPLTDAYIQNVLNYLPIVDAPKPTITSVQYLEYGSVVLISGVPTQEWVVVDMFADIPIGTPDSSGTPSTVLVSKLEQETAYINKLLADGTSELLLHYTGLADRFIQQKVTDWNTNNVSTGMIFDSIASFPKYAVIPNDTRNAISIQFLTWNGKIWDEVNIIKVNALTTGVIPTDEEYLAALSTVVFA